MLIGAALWSAAGSLEFTAVDLRAKIFWSQISYIGIVFGPVALFHFTYAYINDGRLSSRSVSAVPPPTPPPARSWHVLLADDKPLSRRVSAALLER